MMLVYLADAPKNEGLRTKEVERITQLVRASTREADRAGVVVRVEKHPDDPRVDVIMGYAPGDENNLPAQLRPPPPVP